MAAQALLFQPPRGVLIVSGATAPEEWASLLPAGVPEAERLRVATSMARDADDTNATVVLVWPESAAPFGLLIQITPITSIRLAREFVRGGANGWIGRLQAEVIGQGLEWFSPAADDDPASRWSAVFADDELFVNLTLRAPSFSDLVLRRSFVESMVLPSLVIADGAQPWRSDPALAADVIVAKESWPQLAGLEATA